MFYCPDVNTKKSKEKRREESDNIGYVNKQLMENTSSCKKSDHVVSDDDDDEDEDEDDESDSDFDVHASLQHTLVEKQRGTKLVNKANKKNPEKNGFEVVPVSAPG